MKTADSVLQLIGDTPLVKLNKVTSGLEAEVWVKPEYMNPTGSIKDRVALRMIEDAEKQGVLKPGYTIVESSTGNTGTSLSFIGTLKGYRVVIYETTPGKMGQEKKNLMMGYGAEVRTISPEEYDDMRKGVPGAEIELPGRRICLALEKKNPDVWWARQFANPSNVEAQKDTGREILEQTGDKIEAFVASIGTGGTLMGVAEVLKEKNRKTRVVGAIPPGSKKEMKPGKPYPKSDIEGGIIAEMLMRPGLIDEVVTITDEEAVKMTERLWREEGVFAGVSSGANVVATLRLAEDMKKGQKVVAIMHDSGDRYLTTRHYVT
jgi:cysteine synthase A